jgi:hypothetical protein
MQLNKSHMLSSVKQGPSSSHTCVLSCLCLWLQNFRSIKSRGAIQQQMMNKLVDTLEQFLREIIAAQEMFDRCKANPPLTRNQPPVAGGHQHRMRCSCHDTCQPSKELCWVDHSSALCTSF